ncbi:MAG TPA: hypothetical protein VK762_26590 [Polyangiaceae bacterium]|nr:hypothetical protein [Polyangiaceae bacterium]
MLAFVVVSLGVHATGAMMALRHGEAVAAPAFEPTPQTLAGDTLDVEPAAPVSADEDEDEATPTPSPAAPAAVPRVGSGPLAHPHVTAASAASAPAAAASSPPPALFGAVGVRFASDLATTFTRAFPQAASADPLWSAAPFGAASSAELTLVLDDEGHLARTTVSGSPSPALRRGIDRTLALLGTGRAFTAHGAVTRIRLSSRVSRDDVHDGLHGDVFALSGGSFSGDVGNAFFALPPAAGPGRRIDVELRLLP